MLNRRWAMAIVSLMVLAPRGGATEITRTAGERFAAADTQEPADFRRHVLPLLGRMGCNSRGCHGSFQGKGGFRLSLFGYDLKVDHESLTGGAKPRVDVRHPLASLLLKKPTSEDDHGGSQLFKPGDWQYNLLRRWIEGGAKPTTADAPQFERLEVSPRQITFSKLETVTPLHVVACWADGTRENVTDLCRYRSSDEGVATVDADGRIAIQDKGETFVVVGYDNAVVAVPVMLPVSDLIGAKYPVVAAATRIDQLVIAKLRQMGIVPSPICGDADFLRRVSLDLIGTLPTPQEISAFLADGSPDKRARKVDALLETPAYAAWWATKLCDLTGNNSQQQAEQYFREEASRQWYEWIRRRVADNVPYDQIMAGLILGTSVEDSGANPQQGYRAYCETMTAALKKDAPADFAARKTMPFFWSRRNMVKPEERALSFSYAVLGVHLECAQCHKHPYDQWTQRDFEQFKAFFEPIRFGVAPQHGAQFKAMLADAGLQPGKNLNQREIRDKLQQQLAAGKTIPFREVFVAQPPPAAFARFAQKNPTQQKGKNNNARPYAQPGATPKLLGEEEIDSKQYRDPRQALVEWIRRKDNPYFARAWVNRVWAHYFGVGIVEPPDELSRGNPPINGPLLDHLAQEFVAHGYDLKWLHRTILASDAYQRSWQTNATNVADRRNFSHALLRRLPAEVVVDAVAQATAADARLTGFQNNVDARAIGPLSVRQGNYALSVFGRPERVTTCDCERSNEPTLLQTVFLQNDYAVWQQINRGGWLTELFPGYGFGFGGQRGAYGGRQGGNLGLLAFNSGKQGFKPGAAAVKQAPQERRPPETAKNARPVDVDKVVDSIFLRTVSRPPTAAERQEAKATLASAKSRYDGVRDVLWAMLNTKEFIVNH
jgi:hypothetical protein